MKKIILTTSPVFILVLILFSFTRKSAEIKFNTESRNNMGNVRFVLDRMPTPEEMNQLTVRLKVMDSTSKKVVYSNVVKLTPRMGSFVTPVIVLNKGSYVVTEFYVQPENFNARSKDDRIVLLPTIFSVN